MMKSSPLGCSHCRRIICDGHTAQLQAKLAHLGQHAARMKLTMIYNISSVLTEAQGRRLSENLTGSQGAN
jgi:hypothetical protein